MDDYDKYTTSNGASAFELIEFSLIRNIGGKLIRGTYGVNVAKVREVVRMPDINVLGSRVPGVAGIFELRSVAIPAINLAYVLGDHGSEVQKQQQIIVTEFSRKRAGFIVDSTHRIRRVDWDKVLPPASDSSTFMSGMTLIEDNKFLFILDLERILIELEGISSNSGGFAKTGAGGIVDSVQAMAGQLASTPASAIPNPGPEAPGILLVDDSTFILNSVKVALKRLGYRVVTAENGRIALDILQKYAKGSRPDGRIDIVVSDIEMPQMNGLALTRQIRADEALAGMPVILHTSLSGQANQDAGIRAGANGYVIKNDIRCLNELLKEIICKEHIAA